MSLPYFCRSGMMVEAASAHDEAGRLRTRSVWLSRRTGRRACLTRGMHAGASAALARPLTRDSSRRRETCVVVGASPGVTSCTTPQMAAAVMRVGARRMYLPCTCGVPYADVLPGQDRGRRIRVSADAGGHLASPVARGSSHVARAASHLPGCPGDVGTHSDPPAQSRDRCRFLLRPVTPSTHSGAGSGRLGPSGGLPD